MGLIVTVEGDDPREVASVKAEVVEVLRRRGISGEVTAAADPACQDVRPCDVLAGDLTEWDAWVARKVERMKATTDPLSALDEDERRQMLTIANEGRQVPLRSLGRALADYEVIDLAVTMWDRRRAARSAAAVHEWNTAAAAFTEGHGRHVFNRDGDDADDLRAIRRRILSGQVTLAEAWESYPAAANDHVEVEDGSGMFPDEWGGDG